MQDLQRSSSCPKIASLRKSMDLKWPPGMFLLPILHTSLYDRRFYEFPRGSTGSVYTWHGCALKIQNLPEDQMYTAEAPAMQHYAHAHSVLEQQRRAAKERIFERKDASAEGPRALVCGGPSSGKSTVCNVLVNYASRLDWQLTFVDLDISCNSITIPGAVAAAPVDIPVPVEEGYSLFPPLSYFYASSNLDKKGHELYHLHVTSLAEKVNERHALNDNARCGGMIVKAMSSKYTSKDVLHAVRQFRIDTIFVMGDDKLYAQLRSGIAREGMFADMHFLFSSAHPTGLPAKLLQLPRSGGVVTKSDTQRDVARKERIQSYFYGMQHFQQSSAPPHTHHRMAASAAEPTHLHHNRLRENQNRQDRCHAECAHGMSLPIPFLG